MMLSGLSVTMLNGVGCPDCGGTCSNDLGAVITKAEVEKYFIGDKKYVKNAKATAIYRNPGESPFKTIPAHETIGKVVGINDKANWAKLEDGNWINIAPGAIDSFYTAELSVAPPKSVSDAVKREAVKVIDSIPFVSVEGLKWALWIGIGVGSYVAYKKFIADPPRKAAAAA